MAIPTPRLAGRALLAARIAAETPGTDIAIREIMKRGLGIDQLASLPEAFRGLLPLDARPLRAREPRALHSAELPLPRSGPWPHPSSAYGAAYRAEATTPRAVAEKALAALRELSSRTPTMNVLACADEQLTLKDADGATKRYAAGTPIGALDGVPFLVKDEFDVEGLPTRLGTPCEPDVPATTDSTVVARLRHAGGVFLGKTVLTELGMSPIGGNIHYAIPHNAHHGSHAPGGSSTGSAVGVALGLGPLATGGDGGGSIRIPSSLNGIFGLKPTFGRVSRAGDRFLGSVAHAGPLACSAADLAIFLDVVASAPDPEDALTSWAPPPPSGGFSGLLGAGVRGVRIGVPDAEWADASEEVGRAGQDALRALQREGAVLVPLHLPLARHAARIGYLVIAPESLAIHRRDWIEKRQMFGDDLRLAFAVVSGFTALEQLDAQRLRVGLRRELAEALRSVDVIALPTTAVTAPRYTEEDARSSFSDPAAIDGLCRFAFLANLTGVPAGTAPVGMDAAGLPIGLQIVGDAWDEATVLAVLAHLERAEIACVRRPRDAIDLLHTA